ncbi:MAG: DUF3990 domain-containing protein [Lachnospiraceae bacterium]|nr:DUF3990 domain-containing protein [Lachnospiraceae bacterium]
MEFKVIEDIYSFLEISGMTTMELADALEVSRVTISNWLNGNKAISVKHMDSFYEYVFRKGVRLNCIKEQLYREDYLHRNEVLLFHGAKTELDGPLRVDCNKRLNDFGNGFYCGESLEQSAMFVATQPQSTLYMLLFDPDGLRMKRYYVDREWMLTIAYYRGRLQQYEDLPLVRQLKAAREQVDYIVAPIADNRMFEIIDEFIDGEITDEQCQHCLSATNLGNQYVFVSQAAIEHVTLLEKCYLTVSEKERYVQSRKDGFNINRDKVKLARRQYRNQGLYIESSGVMSSKEK